MSETVYSLSVTNCTRKAQCPIVGKVGCPLYQAIEVGSSDTTELTQGLKAAGIAPRDGQKIVGLSVGMNRGRRDDYSCMCVDPNGIKGNITLRYGPKP